MKGDQFEFFGSPARAQRPVTCPAPFPDGGDHRCAICGARNAWFGLGSIRRHPETIKFFCREHRP